MDSGIFSYIRAFGVRWFVTMSGPLSVPLAVIAYFVKNDAAKIILFTTALLCAVFASYWVWKVEREAKIKAEAAINNRENRKKIRIILGGFLAGGRSLMAQCMKEDIPPPIDEGNQWNDNVEDYLAKSLDVSYVERFRSAEGLTLTLVPPSSAPHKRIWHALYTRVCRLHEFANQFPYD